MKNRAKSYKLAIAAEQNIKEKEYWQKKLSGDLVKINFPYDYHRQYKGDKHDAGQSVNQLETFRFPQNLYAETMKLTNGVDVKLHMVLVAGLFILLNKYTAHSDIILGSPLLKQENQSEFINTILVFRNQVRDHMSFKDLLLEVRETIIQANVNQNYPIERLIQQLNIPMQGDGFPLFDVVVLLENIYDKDFIRDIHYNMGFSFLRIDESIEGTVEYNPLLYRESTIKQIIRHYFYVLEQVLHEVNLSLSHIQLLSEKEKKQLLKDFNQKVVGYSRDKDLHQLFEEQVAGSPDRVALTETNRGITLSYRELNQQAQQLALRLKSAGIKPDSVAAIIVEPSIEMLLGMLAILKAGAAYLPMEPDYPEERIRYMLTDSGTDILLTTPGVSVKFEKLSIVDCQLSIINCQPSMNKETPTAAVFSTPLPAARRSTIAYVIYTSGTTGRPKGIMVEHRNVVAYLQAFYREFKITPADTFIHLASYAFDVSIEEIFPVLLRGGKLVIPDVFDMMDANAICRVVARYSVNIIDCTPLLLNELNRLAADKRVHRLLETVHTFISGGDVLRKEYINNLLTIGTVYNTYGPTETTVCAAYYRLPPKKEDIQPGISLTISIGKPIANYKLYILDKAGNLVPIGVIGELSVSGPGVARGYLNRPELTAEKFCLPSPVTRHPSLLFHTGDLARWLTDGNIEFFGRKDHQVKIRGYRIELGEIENVLLNHDYIEEVVVMTRLSEKGERYICAYIVSPQELGVSELRRYLSEHLPDYMIPAYFMTMETLPLTPNGKIDRKALPKPAMTVKSRYTAPRDKVEKKLVEIWGEVLDIKALSANQESVPLIGVNDDFFELGGHSLKATIMASRLHKALDVKVPLADIFKAPTIKGLAEYIKKTGQDKFAPIKPVEKREYYGLSSAQKRLFIQQNMAKDNISYNIPRSLRLEGKIEKEKLEAGFKQLIKRHENLRTSFRMAGPQPIQEIHHYHHVQFSVEQFEIKKEEEVEPLEKSFVRPFDLGKVPLFRVRLITQGDTRAILMFDIHHIITDGTSMNIFVRELMALLQKKELPALKIQYKDFSEWNNSEKESVELKKQEKFWLSQYQEKTQLLNLPLDYVRPQLRSFEGDIFNFEIEKEETNLLNKMALRHGTTLYMVLLTIFNILLSKVCDQEDIIVGTPVAGRRHADLEPIIGFFINMLPLRNFPTGEKNFQDFLLELKERTLKAYDNQDYQFEDLVERVLPKREAGRLSLVDVMFVFQNMELMSGNTGKIPTVETPGLKLTPSEHIIKTSPFDLALAGYETDEKIYFTLLYSTTLFKKETIRVHIKNFEEIVSAVLDNNNIKLKNIETSHDLLIVKSDTQQGDQGDFDFF